MRKRTKIAALTLIFAMTLGLFGCGNSFDASKYLQAQLDNIFKNDSTLLVEQEIDTAENGQKVYEEVMDAQVDGFLYGFDISDELKARYRDIIADMFAKADYTVGEAEKQSDGSFHVSVEYKKMKLFAPVRTELEEKKDELDDAESRFSYMADCMEEELSSGLEYEESKNMVVKIEIENRTYTINTDDIQVLLYDLIDYHALD